MEIYYDDDRLELARDPLAAAAPEPKLRRGLGEEMGVTLNLPFSSMVDDSSWEVLNPEPIGVDRLVNMRRSDAQVRALMRLVTLPIRAALRTAKVSADEGGEAQAKFIEQVFSVPPAAGGMMTPFRQVINQAMLAVVDGFAPFELVWKMPTEGPLAGKYTLHKMARRSPGTVTFIVNDKGEYNGFRQRTHLHGQTIDAIIKPENSFYFAAQEEENPYYGVSYFLPAYWHHDKKIKVYYLLHLAAQMAAVPGRVGIEPPNASKQQKDAFFKALKDYGLGGALRLPMGFEFTEHMRKIELPQFVEIINHHNLMMSKSILAQESMDAGERTNAPLIMNGTESADLFVQQVTTIMEDFENQINTMLIPNLIDWNFGSGKYPHWRFADLTGDQRTVMRQVFGALSVSPSINVTPDFVFELEQQVAKELGMETLDYEGKLRTEFEKAKSLEIEKDELAVENQRLEVEKNETGLEMLKTAPPPGTPGIGAASGVGVGTPGGPGRPKGSTDSPISDSEKAEERKRKDGKLPQGSAGEQVTRAKRTGKTALTYEGHEDGLVSPLDTLAPPMLLSDVARRLLARHTDDE
jgi:hypothetical protein